MTLEQLIKALTDLLAERPDLANAEIVTEGCDCDGKVQSVIPSPSWLSPDTVYLSRYENE